MKKNIICEALYILNTNKTIREAAQDLSISKSALHRHLSINLKKLNYNLYLEIKNLFLEHNRIRHINGGMATKLKYINR